MRVEILEALATSEGPTHHVYSDAAVERALKSFLAAMGSNDSLLDAKLGTIVLSGVDSGNKLCSGTVNLKFRDAKLAKNRAAHFSLLESLDELLKQAGSAESLCVQLCLDTVSSGTDGLELALTLRLEATGNSPEQAGLRWSLGLAHVQQAVLFASRSLRQQFNHAVE